MKAEFKIKRHLLINMVSPTQLDECDWIDLSTTDGITEAWDTAREYDDIFSGTEIIDEMNEFRCMGEASSLECDAYSRHYEVDRVAIKLSCGAYVSWLYWTGGGKHGEPDAIDWIDDAIEVDCKEEVQVVTVRTYSWVADD